MFKIGEYVTVHSGGELHPDWEGKRGKITSRSKRGGVFFYNVDFPSGEYLRLHSSQIKKSRKPKSTKRQHLRKLRE